jgi:RNA polymerase sigma factor (TIGR02999 family)
MRQILVDHARRRGSAKRGSDADRVSIGDVVSFLPARARDIEQLDDALTALAAFDPRKAEIVELRYFGGFGLEEIGQALSISAATVRRDQRMAEAWLHREMARSAGPGL